MPEEVEIKIDEFSANGSNIYTANWTFLPSRFGSSSAFFKFIFSLSLPFRAQIYLIFSLSVRAANRL